MKDHKASEIQKYKIIINIIIIITDELKVNRRRKQKFISK